MQKVQVQSNHVRHGTARHATLLYGTIRYCTVLCYTVYCSDSPAVAQVLLTRLNALGVGDGLIRV